MDRLDEIEANLKAVTDRVGGLMDEVRGKGLVPAFRCGHSGLYFGGDYIKQWGRKYGIGLGPSPVSEVLDSRYECAPPKLTAAIRSIDQIMHPLMHTAAQVDMVMVRPEVLEAESAVPAILDPYMRQRVSIIMRKQLVNPQSRLPMLRAFMASKGVAK